MSNDNKELEIVAGNAEDLDISPVYNHINAVKPNCNNKPKNIVIPKNKKIKHKKANNDKENTKEDTI